MAAGTALLYYVGSLHVLSGTLTLGELLVFSAYLVMLYQPIEQLAYTAWTLEGAAAGAQRCFEVLDQEDELADRPNAQVLNSTRAHIQFEHVSFGYDPQRLVLQDINMEIRPGETIAFVGSTGSGKSTLLSLVPRFYDPSSGTVKIDGHDLRDLTKKSLRQHISIVLQDTILFSTTIRENIAYGRPDGVGSRNRRGRQARASARIYHWPSSGLFEPSRRTWLSVECWPETTHWYCACIPQRRARLTARRTYVGTGSNHRGLAHGDNS